MDRRSLLDGTFPLSSAFFAMNIDRLKNAQIGEPIWQPVIFAILVILISVTLYFILET